MLKEEITQKNYKKFKLTKSSFYKIYSRVLFFRSVIEPVKFMVLNLSEREFKAVKDFKLKGDIKSKKQGMGFKSFSMGSGKLSNKAGELNE
jgi:hypothetical protein